MFIDQSPPHALNAAPAAPTVNCDDVRAPQAVMSAGGLYLGEMHGTQESPQVVLCVVNQTLETHKGPVVFVFELPDEAADLTSAFWTQVDPGGGDGRSSKAMAELVVRLQALSRNHANLKLVYMDNCSGPADVKPEDVAGYRDACMGRTLEAQSHNGYLVAYSGNFHNLRTLPAGMSATYLPAAHFLPATIKTANIVAYDGGSYWNFGVKTAQAMGATLPAGFMADPTRSYDYWVMIKSYTASTPYATAPAGPSGDTGAAAVVIDRCDLPPDLVAAPGIVFGARQGTNEAPALFTCMVKAALKARTGPVTVALDMPESAQDLGSRFWTDTQKAGLNSQALRAQWSELAALARTEPRLELDFQEQCRFTSMPGDVLAALHQCYADHLTALAGSGFFMAQRDLDFTYRRAPKESPYVFTPMAGRLDPAIRTVGFETGPRQGFYEPDDHAFDYVYDVPATTPSFRATVQATQASLPDEPPVNGVTLKDLGIEGLISQREANLIFTYADRSNAVRETLQQAFDEPASPERERHVQTAQEAMSEVDEAVHPALTALITHGFWQKPGPRNTAFDNGVWLALQHIFDQALVDITLEQTAPLVKSGQFSGQSWALMYDRNEISHNRPQKFGSQMTCKAGVLVPYDLVDPQQVEAFRKAYGFTQTLQEYLDFFEGKGC